MKTAPPRDGFSLIEVALALGVVSFAMVSLVALLPTGIATNQDSLLQTAAMNIATGIASDLKQAPSAAIIATNPALSPRSPEYGIDAGSDTTTTLYLDENGSKRPSAESARYKATVILLQPGSGSRNATRGSVVIAWPAAAAVPLGSVSIFVGMDRN